MTVHPVPRPSRRPKKPRAAIKKVNAARKRREFARAYGSKERVAWVKTLPCIYSPVSSFCDGEIHNHHIRVDGAGRKAGSRFIVPVCAWHHGVLHRAVKLVCFEMVDLDAEAARVESLWKARSET